MSRAAKNREIVKCVNRDQVTTSRSHYNYRATVD